MPDKPGSDRLLRPADVAERLGISVSLFHYLRVRLLAAGLRAVQVPGRTGRQITRYTSSSLDRMIRRAAEREAPLC